MLIPPFSAKLVNQYFSTIVYKQFKNLIIFAIFCLLNDYNDESNVNAGLATVFFPSNVCHLSTMLTALLLPLFFFLNLIKINESNIRYVNKTSFCRR